MSPGSLNLGCGGMYRYGYVNVDTLNNSAADVYADASLLPFCDGAFERTEMIHVIEHLGYLKGLHSLAEAHRVLEPHGMVVIETPDIDGTFERFLGSDSQEVKAQLLSWTFGLQAPGYEHRLLYPGDLLRHMLDRAGFSDIRVETQRHHRYAPGLRMTARRGGLPVHRLLSNLRRWVLTSTQTDLSHQLHALEFERTFVNTVLALGGASQPPSDPLESALANILMSPASAGTWLDLCVSGEMDFPLDTERLARTAHAAVAEQMPKRMESLFDEFCEAGAEVGDGWEQLRERGMAALRNVWEGPPGRERAALSDSLPAPVEGAGWLGRCPLCRVVFEARVGGMHDRAVRLLCLGREAEGTTLLERAARSRINPLYPLWNLAVAHAARGRLDLSIGRYIEALDLAPPETAGVLARELFAVYMRADRRVEADELARRRLWGAAGPGPLQLRTRPVMAGEGFFHVSDPE